MADQEFHREDYISASAVKNVIKSILTVVFDTAAFFVRAVRNHKSIFLSILGVGLVFGAVFYFLTPRLYEYSLMGEYNVLTKRNYSEIFDQLNGQIQNNSNAELANELHIDRSIADKLVRFDLQGVDGDDIAHDTSTKHQGFLVASVTLRDPVNIVVLQDALVQYINNLPYLKKLKEGEKQIYEQSLQFVNQEQIRLDSLKDLYNRFIAGGKLPSTFYNNAFDPADIYTRSGELQEQRNELTLWRATREEAFSLIDGFKRNYNPSTKTLAADIAISGLISFFLAFFICLAMEIKVNLK